MHICGHTSPAISWAPKSTIFAPPLKNHLSEITQKRSLAKCARTHKYKCDRGGMFGERAYDQVRSAARRIAIQSAILSAGACSANARNNSVLRILGEHTLSAFVSSARGLHFNSAHFA